MPLACGMYITNICNLRCSSCNIWRKPIKKTIPKERAFFLVDELGHNGCFYFSISGGEPLLVPYLPELLQRAKSVGIDYTHLVTNGMSLTPKKARQFNQSGLDEISISIDGPKAAHDERRGQEGAYDAAMQAVENIHNYAPKIKIVLNTILSPKNPEHCLHVVQMAEKMKLSIKVQPFVLHPDFGQSHGKADDERDGVEDTRTCLKTVIDYLKVSHSVINTNSFLGLLNLYFSNPDDLPLSREKCQFGYHHMEVAEDGNIYACLEGQQWKGGLSVQNRLRNVLDCDDYGSRLRALADCHRCRANMYVCYFEPRLNFPLWNFCKYRLLHT